MILDMPASLLPAIKPEPRATYLSSLEVPQVSISPIWNEVFDYALL